MNDQTGSFGTRARWAAPQRGSSLSDEFACCLASNQWEAREELVMAERVKGPASSICRSAGVLCLDGGATLVLRFQARTGACGASRPGEEG